MKRRFSRNERGCEELVAICVGVIFVVFVVALIFVASNNKQNKPEQATVTLKDTKTGEVCKNEFDMTKVTTIGNSSYAPLGLDGSALKGVPSEHIELILKIKQSFENAHPDLHVTGWRTESQQSSENTSALTFGIWIDHEPKEKEGGK